MVGEKLDQLLTTLALTPEEFADKIKVGKSAIYKLLRGDTKSITLKMAKKINAEFPKYSVDFLLAFNKQAGEDVGEAYFENKTQIDTIESIPRLSKRGVPYYDVDFHGGFDIVLNDQTVQPSYYIDFPPYNHADAWINVTGKSMSPFISHGDIAALKALSDWRIFFPVGEVYAIYTNEHRFIKIVSEGKDIDHLTLISYNKSKEFVDQQIPRKVIKQMFRVLGSIKKFF